MEGRSGSPIAFERDTNRADPSSPRRSPSCFSQCQKKKGVGHPPRSRQNRAFRAGRPFAIDAPGPGVDRQTHSGLRGGRTRRQWALPTDNVSNPLFFRRRSFHDERSEHDRSFRGSVGEPERFRTRYQPPISHIATSSLRSTWHMCPRWTHVPLSLITRFQTRKILR